MNKAYEYTYTFEAGPGKGVFEYSVKKFHASVHELKSDVVFISYKLEFVDMRENVLTIINDMRENVCFLREPIWVEHNPAGVTGNVDECFYAIITRDPITAEYSRAPVRKEVLIKVTGCEFYFDDDAYCKITN